MSLHLRYISFLWQVADLGCTLNMPLLRDGARLLMKLMPPGTLSFSLTLSFFLNIACCLSVAPKQHLSSFLCVSLSLTVV